MQPPKLLAILLFTAAIALHGADKDLAVYKPLMKAAASASDDLKSALKKEDPAAARTGADELSKSMAQIEEFWSKRGDTEAAGWSANLKQAGADIAAKADSGDFAAAATLFESAKENCSSCHDAHRKMSLGGWKLK